MECVRLLIGMWTVCPAAKKLPKGTSGPQRTATGSREPYVSDRQPQQQSVSPQYCCMLWYLHLYVVNYNCIAFTCTCMYLGFISYCVWRQMFEAHNFMDWLSLTFCENSFADEEFP